MSVRIRLKKMGRRHRPYFRICVMDARTPRDGKAIEEVGTYDPMIRDTDKTCTMKADRIDYWLGVGAQPTPNVARLIEKFKGKVPDVRVDRQKDRPVGAPPTPTDLKAEQEAATGVPQAASATATEEPAAPAAAPAEEAKPAETAEAAEVPKPEAPAEDAEKTEASS